MRFRNKYPVRREHLQNALDDGVDVFDMGEAIGRGDHLGPAILGSDLARDILAEVALQGRDAAMTGDLGDIRRFDAENAVPTLLEIGNQRAVVGTDVDAEI